MGGFVPAAALSALQIGISSTQQERRAEAAQAAARADGKAKIAQLQLAEADELHVEVVSLSSKVGIGLAASTKTHAHEIENLKIGQKKLADEVALRSKEAEVRHVRLSADLTFLQNNVAKIDQLRRVISEEIRTEGDGFIENLRKHRDEERVERATIELERRYELAKLASERKLYIIVGTVSIAVFLPLLLRLIDSVVVNM